MIKIRTMDELEEFLTDKLIEELPDFSIEILEDGKIVIFTGLAEDTDTGELVEVDDLELDIDDLEEEDRDDDK